MYFFKFRKSFKIAVIPMKKKETQVYVNVFQTSLWIQYYRYLTYRYVIIIICFKFN